MTSDHAGLGVSVATTISNTSRGRVSSAASTLCGFFSSKAI
jgi:hypothetical protein